MMRDAYCVRRELGAGAGSEWVECHSRLLLLLARSSRLVARSSREGMMCRKVVWLIGALTGLVWLGGMAQGCLPDTPKVRLSVAPGARGVVPGHGTNGTNGTDGTGAGRVVRPREAASCEPRTACRETSGSLFSRVTRHREASSHELRASSQEGRGERACKLPHPVRSSHASTGSFELRAGRKEQEERAGCEPVRPWSALLTRHVPASRVRAEEAACGVRGAPGELQGRFGQRGIAVSGGSARGSPFLRQERGSAARDALMARGDRQSPSRRAIRSCG